MDDSVKFNYDESRSKFTLKSPGANSLPCFDFPFRSITPFGSITTNNVPIFVKSDWNSLNNENFESFFFQNGQIQLCPAIFVPTPQHIPQAVKHIFSRLASAAKEIDQGIPELLLSLTGNDNSLNFEVFFFN